MKHSSPANRSTPAEREARVGSVVAKAKARGEKIPRGVKLIGFREPTAAEREFAKRLVPLARKSPSRPKVAA